MYTKGSKAVLLALVLLLGATAAHATDACYRDASGNTFVFKRFKMPRAGDCQPLNGHRNDSENTLDGTVCGTSDGSLVRFNFDYVSQSSGYGTYVFVTDRLDNPGDGQYCQESLSTGRWTCPSSLVSKITCPTTKTIY